MKILLAGLVVALSLATAPLAQETYDDLSNQQIIDQAPATHPAALYHLAARLLSEGEGQDAANWMYLAQLRYRFLVEASDDPEQDSILFAALHESVGRPINEYIGGDVDEWLAAMDWALEWDATHDNLVTSKTDHAAALAKIRDGLADLRAQVEASRDTIPIERAENGLENR